MTEYNGLLYTDDTFEVCIGSKDRNIEVLDFHPNTKEIRAESFSDYKKISKVTLPEGIKKICIKAFSFSSITEINFPASLEVIDMLAFDSTKLKVVDLSKSSATIGSYCFANCEELEKAFFCDNTLQPSCFQGCINLEEVDLSKIRNIEIPGQCFCNCKKLKTVTLSDDITIIGQEAFAHTDVSNINWPAKLEKIIYHAFLDSGITNIDLSNRKSVFIEKASFEGCEKLESFNFNNSTIILGDEAFSGCKNLKIADLSKTNIKRIPKICFQNCENLENAYLPDGLKEIGAGAFHYCKKLKDMLIPDTVERIEGRAFDKTNFKSICIPKDLISLGNIFTGSSIENYYYKGSLDEVDDYVLEVICKYMEQITDRRFVFKELTFDSLYKENRSFKEINDLQKRFEK